MEREEYGWGSTGSEKKDHLFLEQLFQKINLSDG